MSLGLLMLNYRKLQLYLVVAVSKRKIFVMKAFLAFITDRSTHAMVLAQLKQFNSSVKALQKRRKWPSQMIL